MLKILLRFSRMLNTWPCACRVKPPIFFLLLRSISVPSLWRRPSWGQSSTVFFFSLSLSSCRGRRVVVIVVSSYIGYTSYRLVTSVLSRNRKHSWLAFIASLCIALHDRRILWGATLVLHVNLRSSSCHQPKLESSLWYGGGVYVNVFLRCSMFDFVISEKPQDHAFFQKRSLLCGWWLVRGDQKK